MPEYTCEECGSNLEECRKCAGTGKVFRLIGDACDDCGQTGQVCIRDTSHSFNAR